MAPDTFHRFPSLPQEIQDEIWTWATPDLNDDYSNYVQYFSVDLSKQEPDNPDALLQLSPPKSGTFRKSTQRKSMGAKPETTEDPIGTELDDSDWTKYNPSGYLIDYGVATACKNSRNAMERKYRKYGKGGKSPETSDKNKDTVRPTITYVDSFKAYLAVSPKTNLFCFHFDPLQVLKGPIDFSSLTRPTVFDGASGAVHMALEFDQIWQAICAENGGFTEDLLRNTRRPELESVWDKRLHRKWCTMSIFESLLDLAFVPRAGESSKWTLSLIDRQRKAPSDCRLPSYGQSNAVYDTYPSPSSPIHQFVEVPTSYDLPYGIGIWSDEWRTRWPSICSFFYLDLEYAFFLRQGRRGHFRNPFSVDRGTDGLRGDEREGMTLRMLRIAC